MTIKDNSVTQLATVFINGAPHAGGPDSFTLWWRYKLYSYEAH